MCIHINVETTTENEKVETEKTQLELEEKAEERNIEIKVVQSNHEGVLVEYIQECYFEKYDGIIINPGAYTHTSIALLDALKAVKIKTIEVHISDISKRESFRQISYIRSECLASIIGKGMDGYLLAIDQLIYECNN